MLRGFAAYEQDYIRGEFEPDFSWRIESEPSRRTRPAGALAGARIGLVSTAGVLVRGQRRFDPDGDDSYRAIPTDIDVGRLRLFHPGYDTARARRDIEVVFPLGTLRALVEAGEVGAIADTAYGLMGYVPFTDRLVAERGPELAGRMRGEGVDLALLVPT